MTTRFTAKQPYEEYLIYFDFTAKLGAVETIASATITAVDEATLAVVTTTVLDATKQTDITTTPIVYTGVRAGTDGHSYLITCRVTGSLGSLYELEGILPITATPSTSAGGTRCVVEPTEEPVSVSDLKLQLNVDSNSIVDNTTLYQSLPAGSYPITYELMTLDVAPATAWAVGDTITGQTSSQTCIVVTVITTKTFIIKSRSGAFTLGEIVGVTGVAGKLADQGAANPTFSTTYNTGYLALGTAVDVLGHNAVVYLVPVNNGIGGTVDCKIQEADVSTGPFTDWSGGGFTQVTESNDTAVQEKQYTGVKQYIRTVAKTLVAACEFGTSIMVWEPVSAEDSMLLEDIQTARRDVENDLGRKIMSQTWDYCPKCWPDGDRIKIPFGNLQLISYITYKDSAGTTTTLTVDTDYLVELNGLQCGFVVLPYQGSWPSSELWPSNPITIRFICGYSTTADVPTNIKRAVKSRAVNYYMNRGDDVVGQVVTSDKTYERLLNSCGRLFDMDFA